MYINTYKYYINLLSYALTFALFVRVSKNRKKLHNGKKMGTVQVLHFNGTYLRRYVHRSGYIIILKPFLSLKENNEINILFSFQPIRTEPTYISKYSIFVL